MDVSGEAVVSSKERGGPRGGRVKDPAPVGDQRARSADDFQAVVHCFLKVFSFFKRLMSDLLGDLCKTYITGRDSPCTNGRGTM